MAENITAHMDKSLESLKHNFSKVRTGRANANILSDITVDYYGVPTPVTQVAAVKTPEAHMLLIEPWDKALINAIVKAIGASDLGITPNSDGTVVRLPFPAPTEERRRELVKECREYAEQAKVSILSETITPLLWYLPLSPIRTSIGKKCARPTSEWT